MAFALQPVAEHPHDSRHHGKRHGKAKIAVHDRLAFCLTIGCQLHTRKLVSGRAVRRDAQAFRLAHELAARTDVGAVVGDGGLAMLMAELSISTGLTGVTPELQALADQVPDVAMRLAETFWPGALTMILRAQPSLNWNLGETKGTVALRMPDHKIALALLEEVGPMAVSSANLTGKPAATTCQQAEAYLGESVQVYLDGGNSPKGEASTILDLTGLVDTYADGKLVTAGKIRLVRAGALSAEKIRSIAGDLLEGAND